MTEVRRTGDNSGDKVATTALLVAKDTSQGPDVVVTNDTVTKGCSSDSQPIQSDGRSSSDSQDHQDKNKQLRVDINCPEDSGDSIETVKITTTNTNNSSSMSKASKKQSNGKSKESLEAKRERKAAKTLAIITGVFVICWLPFFIIALLMPLCGPLCEPPKVVFEIFLWLGYVNSTLNPIIYTIFSPDFRSAFKRILLGRKTPSRSPCRV